MDLNTAKELTRAALKKAQEMNRLCSVAIVDDRGFLISLYRMSNTPIPTVDIARNKAWTAATFRMPSPDIAKFGNPSSPGYGFNTQNWNDRLTTIAGGLPVKNGDTVIGGIGVSGGTPEEDVIIGQAAIDAAVFDAEPIK